jgi:hypothetical protein
MNPRKRAILEINGKRTIAVKKLPITQWMKNTT